MSDVVVLGSGRLHEALGGLGAPADGPGDLAAGCRAAVVAVDTGRVPGYPELHRAAARRGVPLLAVRVELGRVLIGPVVMPGEPGCLSCLRRRRGGNRAGETARGRLLREHGERRPAVTATAAGAVTSLVADELDRLDRDPATARTRAALLTVSLRTGVTTRHEVLAHPLCPTCGALPPDEPRGLVPRPLPKPDPAVLRIGGLRERRAELERRYVDAETGVIASLGVSPRDGEPSVVARLDPGRGGDDSRHGYGHGADHDTAATTAIAEALERLGGGFPRGRRTSVHAAYDEVAGHAIDPRTLGLYPDDWYDRPGFPFARFDPARATSWVWGYSFGRAEPVLVPESYAYYRAGRTDDPGFAYECSNGCALGGCLEEAILHGLLEVAERDAFLLTWYAARRAPRVELDGAAGRRVAVAVETIRQRHGYRVLAFDITQEQGIPAFWALAVNDTADPRRPRLCSAAGAHPDPRRALLRAIAEAGSAIGNLERRYDHHAAGRLLTDAGLVREMHDHALLYGHPGAADRLAFLPTGDPGQPLRERTWPLHHDLGEDLAEGVGRFRSTGLDVVAVDVTSPEHRAGSFACAKVIVPGALPMTFGHGFRRTHGLPRLDAAAGAGGIHPYPHPFP